MAHPGFRKIPDCLFPLKTEEAQARYNALARMMFDAGRMSMSAHQWLSSGCSQFDQIVRAEREDRPLRASWYAQMNKAFDRLRLDDLDSPIAAPKDAPVNKFARSGFSTRSR